MLTKQFKNIIKFVLICLYIVSLSLSSYVTHASIDQTNMMHQFNSEIVSQLQYKPNELTYYDGLVNEQYDLHTQYTFKPFQSSHRVEITAQSDQIEMEALINEKKESYIKELRPIAHQIHYDSDKDDITFVQEKLHHLGYYTGRIDGIYGPLTEKAIQQLYDENRTNDDEHNINNDHENDMTEDEKTVEVNSDVQVKQADISIIDTARSYIGTPYVWGGQSPSGFDCSGFIQFVYNEQNKSIPRTVSDIWHFSESVQTPSVGDLVFFETYKSGPSHLGIYLGNGDFIHAGSSRGVEISNLDNSYWSANYLGAKRIN